MWKTSKECPTLYCDARVTCTACACFVQGVARTTSGLARHLRLHVLAHHGRPLERESGDPASARSRLLHHSHARKSASYSFLRSIIALLTLVFVFSGPTSKQSVVTWRDCYKMSLEFQCSKSCGETSCLIPPTSIPSLKVHD